jgi:hypothetical protein
VAGAFPPLTGPWWELIYDGHAFPVPSYVPKVGGAHGGRILVPKCSTRAPRPERQGQIMSLSVAAPCHTVIFPPHSYRFRSEYLGRKSLSEFSPFGSKFGLRILPADEEDLEDGTEEPSTFVTIFCR